MSSEFLEFVQFYKRKGWQMIPLRERTKDQPLVRWKQNSSVDDKILKQWWGVNGRFLNSNIAIRTGAGSNLVVLDIDPRHGGDDNFLALGLDTLLPKTPMVRTGSGGRHYYFQHREVKNSSSKIAEGIDIRGGENGKDGYVVAPPSIHPITGNTYEWEVPPSEVEVAELPEALFALIQSSRKKSPLKKGKLTPGTWHDFVRDYSMKVAPHVHSLDELREKVKAELVLREDPLTEEGTPDFDESTRSAYEKAGSTKTWKEADPIVLTTTEAQNLLKEIEDQIKRYVILPSDEALWATVLWIVHTHVFEEFDTSPYLRVQSAEKQSGKSLLLDVIGPLTARPQPTANISEAALFRLVEERKPTLIFDETDGIFNEHSDSNGRYEPLRSLLNTGNRRGFPAIRMEGEGTSMKIKEFNVFCPKVLSGLRDLPDTLHDRSIVIRMLRRMSDEAVSDYRFRKVTAESKILHDRIEGWAVTLKNKLPETVELPPGLSDRAMDLWEPLAIIADYVGGVWPDRLARATRSLNDSHQELSLGAQLLTDIRDFFVTDEMSGKEILDKLNNLPDRPWSSYRHGREMNLWTLSNLLKQFGVLPEKSGKQRVNRYHRANFAVIWARYIPAYEEPEVEEKTEIETGEAIKSKEILI